MFGPEFFHLQSICSYPLFVGKWVEVSESTLVKRSHFNIYIENLKARQKLEHRGYAGHSSCLFLGFTPKPVER